MQLEGLLKTLFLILAPAFTGAFGWWRGHRKSKAESTGVELQNVEKAITVWRGLAEQMEGKCDELLHEISGLRKDNTQLRTEMSGLRLENQEMRLENKELKRKIEALEMTLSRVESQHP